MLQNTTASLRTSFAFEECSNDESPRNLRRRRRKVSTNTACSSATINLCRIRSVIICLLALLACTERKGCGVVLLSDAASAKASQNRPFQYRKVSSWPHRQDALSFLRCGAMTRNKTMPIRPPQTSPPHDPIPSSEKGSSEPQNTVTQENESQDDPRVLMLIRLLFVTYYASLGSLLPYLPVYYHSLGHGGQIIGMLGAIKPFTTFLVAPFWGIVSDQTGSPFTVLYFTFLVSLVGQLMVAWRHDPTYIMIMVFITAFFNAPVKSLLDSMVMDHLVDRSRYGRLRLWGQLGFGIGSSSVGVLLSRSKDREFNPTPGITIFQKLNNFWQSLTGFKLLFLAYAMLSIPTWYCIRAFHRLHDEKEKEKEKVMGELSKGDKSNLAPAAKSVGFWDGIGVLFHNSDALLFFFLVLVVGISSGVVENFAYVRIREVGGTGKDMGLSRLVSSMAGAPMFWFSGPLTEMFGADRIIVISLLSYVARFLIYAMMKHPYQGLPAEAMRGVTFAAFWSTCTIYASRIAPPGLGATMLMFLNAMYGGLGQSVGAIVGGKLQSKIGTVQTFYYSAACDACFVALVILYLSVRKESNFKNPTPIVPKGAVEIEHVVEQEEAPNEVDSNEGHSHQGHSHQGHSHQGHSHQGHSHQQHINQGHSHQQHINQDDSKEKVA